ncbi:PucR family transcriptional regulator [Nocardioides ultimimeridianus]
MTVTALPVTARNARAATAPVPPQVIAHIRADLPALSADVLSTVCRVVPSLRPLVEQHRAQAARAVTLNVTTFLDRLQMPYRRLPERDEICRQLGRLQAGEPDGLVALETALRVGVRVSWRRFVQLAERAQVPSRVQSRIADELFGYLAEMTALAREGHTDALASRGDLAASRRELVRVLIDGPSDPRALAEHAERADWPLPAQVTAVVAVRAPGAEVETGRLPGEVLTDTSTTRTILLVPGAADPQVCDDLRRALQVTSLAVGPPVPTEHAADSLHWARRLLRMQESGQVTHTSVARTEDHVLSLLLTEHPHLGACLRSHHLAALDGLTASRRERMMETLGCWLSLRGDVADMAEALGVHPQTVRYRMRQLRDLFGARLEDPQWRIETEVALHAASLARD